MLGAFALPIEISQGSPGKDLRQPVVFESGDFIKSSVLIRPPFYHRAEEVGRKSEMTPVSNAIENPKR
jgi:hypothetical protein